MEAESVVEMYCSNSATEVNHWLGCGEWTKIDVGFSREICSVRENRRRPVEHSKSLDWSVSNRLENDEHWVLLRNGLKHESWSPLNSFIAFRIVSVSTDHWFGALIDTSAFHACWCLGNVSGLHRGDRRRSTQFCETTFLCMRWWSYQQQRGTTLLKSHRSYQRFRTLLVRCLCRLMSQSIS